MPAGLADMKVNCKDYLRSLAVEPVSTSASLVMPGLVPGIHVLAASGSRKDVDGRDKPGHDGK
jgi:hypothetical protein